MSFSQIAIPIPTKLFLSVSARLREQGSDRDPVDAIHHAIELWLMSGSPRTESAQLTVTPLKAADMAPSANERVTDNAFRDDAGQPPETEERDGYWWKLVFLPSGTKVRMTYRGRMAQAEIAPGGIVYRGQTITPSEFTHRVTNTNRNAWRDIEVLFPGSQSWLSADDLRKSAHKTP